MVAKAFNTACLECDLLIELPRLHEGQKAQCPRCRSMIASFPPDGLMRSLAFSMAAAILLALANFFPFLSFQASGLEQVMTLPESAGELFKEGFEMLALLVLIFILIAPAMLAAGLIVLLVPLVARTPQPWLSHVGRLVFLIGPWSMVEIFLIGVLVSFTKIASMATVVLGISFWAFVGFAICLTAALSSLDRLQLWAAIEEMQQ